MRKKVFALWLSFAIVVSFSSASFVYAAETADDVQNELDSVTEAQDETSAELAQVEEDIKSLTAKVNSLNNEISQTEADIADAEEKISDKEKEMTEREDNLNQRLRVMYKNGSIGFIDVLLGSNSISEFVSNLELIQKIYENDVDVMETLQEEYDELAAMKADLDEKKTELSAQQQELDAEKADLDSKKAELEAQEDQLEAEAKALEQKLLSMIDTSSEFVGGVFIWPCPSSHYITSYFGYRLHPVLNVWKYHSGMDIGASHGASILAAGSGKVILAQEYGGYGNCVIIDHGGGVVSLYGHASQLLVSVGQVVTQGQEIAKVGSTGISTGPHLHFEVRENGVCVEPMDYLKG